jgi:hypothetical protein
LDNCRINNIVQHFATAFLALYLKDCSATGDYLDVTVGEVGIDDRGFTAIMH